MSDTYDPAGLSQHGPCDMPESAPLLRDNLGDVPDHFRALLLERLDFGEKKYEKPLRIGWEDARQAAKEEALDGYNYARLMDRHDIATVFKVAWDLLSAGESSEARARSEVQAARRTRLVFKHFHPAALLAQQLAEVDGTPDALAFGHLRLQARQLVSEISDDALEASR